MQATVVATAAAVQTAASTEGGKPKFEIHPTVEEQAEVR